MGGEIYLGVAEDGKVLGLSSEVIDKMIQDIANTLNNPDKLEPPFLLYPEKIIMNGKVVLRLQVPQSSRVHRLNGVVYDRSADGDFKIKNPELISRMVAKKTAYYSELRLYPRIGLKELDSETIQTARGYLSNKKADHPWLKLKGFAFLKQAGLTHFDVEAGKEVINLAGVLLFGKELTIQSVLPQFKIDVLIKKEQLERYDNRLDLRVNLIESYLKIMPFIAPYLPDPFYLEGITRISLRDRIFRELVANLIVHREYTSHLPARIQVYKNSIEFTNPCVPHYHGKLIAGRFAPYQKNPLISKFFLQLGWVEEIGSGFENVHKWLPKYQKKAKIEFLENEVFTTKVNFAKEDVQPESRLESRLESALAAKIMILLNEGHLGKSLMAKKLGHKTVSGEIHKQIKRLQALDLITITLSDKPNSRLQKYQLTKLGVEQIDSHEEIGVELRLESQPESQLESPLAKEVIILLQSGPMGKASLAQKLGHKTVSGELHKQIKKLLILGLIETTIPEKPNSRLQKYKLKTKK